MTGLGLGLYDSSDGGEGNNEKSSKEVSRKKVSQGKKSRRRSRKDKEMEQSQLEASEERTGSIEIPLLNDIIHESDDNRGWKIYTNRVREILGGSDGSGGRDEQSNHFWSDGQERIESDHENITVRNAFFNLATGYGTDLKSVDATDTEDERNDQDEKSAPLVTHSQGQYTIAMTDHSPNGNEVERNISFDLHYATEESDVDQRPKNDKYSSVEKSNESQDSNDEVTDDNVPHAFAYASLRDAEDEHFNKAISRLSKIFDGTLKESKRKKGSNKKSLRKLMERGTLSKTAGVDLKKYLDRAAFESTLDVNLDNSLDSLESGRTTVSALSDGTWNKLAPMVQTETQQTVSFSNVETSSSKPHERPGGLMLSEKLGRRQKSSTANVRKDHSVRDSSENDDAIERLFRDMMIDGVSNDAEMAKLLSVNRGNSQSQSMLEDMEGEKTKTLTENQWEELIERITRPFEKRQRKMEEILKQREYQEEQHCVFRPNINKRSRKLAEGNVPLLDRQVTILRDRSFKIADRKKKALESEEVKLTFSPIINTLSKGLQRGTQSFEEWLNIRENKRERMVKGKEEQEVEGCTFRPSISNRSLQIMERKKDGKTVVERNLDFVVNRTQKLLSKIEEGLNEERTPRITKKALTMERSEPVGDRLYKLAMESLTRKEELRKRQFEDDAYYYGDYDEKVAPSKKTSSHGSQKRSHWKRKEQAQQQQQGYEADDDGDVRRSMGLSIDIPPLSFGNLRRNAAMELNGDGVGKVIQGTEVRMLQRKEKHRQSLASATKSISRQRELDDLYYQDATKNVSHQSVMASTGFVPISMYETEDRASSSSSPETVVRSPMQQDTESTTVAYEQRTSKSSTQGKSFSPTQSKRDKQFAATQSLSLINYPSDVETTDNAEYYYDDSDVSSVPGTPNVPPGIMKRAQETLQKYHMQY